MMYLIWQDDDRRRSAADKIAVGIRAYRERFGVSPAQVLVNTADYCTDIPGVRLGVEEGAVVQPSQFWLGPVGE